MKKTKRPKKRALARKAARNTTWAARESIITSLRSAADSLEADEIQVDMDITPTHIGFRITLTVGGDIGAWTKRFQKRSPKNL